MPAWRAGYARRAFTSSDTATAPWSWKRSRRLAWRGLLVLPEVSQEIRPLTLRRYPVVEIVSFGSVDEDPPLTVDDYQLDAFRGRLWRLHEGQRSYWSWHWSNTALMSLEITYTGGYDNPDNLPPDLQAACLSLPQDPQRHVRARPVFALAGNPRRDQAKNTTIRRLPGQSALPPEICEMLRPFQEFNS